MLFKAHHILHKNPNLLRTIFNLNQAQQPAQNAIRNSVVENTERIFTDTARNRHWSAKMNYAREIGTALEMTI